MAVAIKKTATVLIKVGGATSELASKGIALCRDCVGPQIVVEDLLMRPKGDLTAKEIHEALAGAAPTYKALVKYYSDLKALEEHHNRGLSDKDVTKVKGRRRQ